MRFFPSGPVRLPQLRPYTPKPDDPPVFWFNSERDEIVQEVADRIVAANAGSRQKLEYALNEVAFDESQRLARQRDEEAQASLGYWRGLQRRVSRMSDDEKKLELAKIVRRMASDVAGNFDPRVYKFAETVVPRLLTGVMSPMALPQELVKPHSKLSEILEVQGPVDKLARLSRKGTLVFVPTHSSNLDSVVLGYALQRTKLPPVVYGAGKNLFTNPIVSFFMHNLGAYRVDRRVGARLYKDVLKSYSAVMIERGYHSLFFPGGTRSRSGLIERHLKLGLAGTGVEAFARSAVNGKPRPVWFVPVTINYALALEAETLIEDHLKEKGKARYIIEDDEFSRIDRWIAFFRKVTTMEQPCVLRFCEPMDPFGNDVDDDGRSLTPYGTTTDPVQYVSRDGKPVLDPERDRAYTEDLGERLAQRFQRDTVLMGTQVVAHLLYRRLVRAVPGVDEFVRCRHRGDVTVPREELVRELGDARDRLVELEKHGMVRVSELVRSETPDYVLTRALDAFNGYHTHETVMDVGAEVSIQEPNLLLYYQNRLVPFATAIADETNMVAAREIERMGAR